MIFNDKFQKAQSCIGMVGFHIDEARKLVEKAGRYPEGSDSHKESLKSADAEISKARDNIAAAEGYVSGSGEVIH